MRFALGSDHAGFIMRGALAKWLSARGHEVQQYGATSEEAYDYPIAADLVAAKLIDKEADFGVLVCGSGIGICIRANRHPGIRAAHCLNEGMAALARQHNHANVLCLGEREIAEDVAERILERFIETDEDEAERHVRRVAELDDALAEQLERTK